jgi:hypothetical protein
MNTFDFTKFDAARAIEKWPEDWRYEYEERAGILEYDAGYERREAEFRAYWEIERKRRAAGATATRCE